MVRKEPSATKRPLLPLFDQSPDVILAEVTLSILPLRRRSLNSL